MKFTDTQAAAIGPPDGNLQLTPYAGSAKAEVVYPRESLSGESDQLNSAGTANLAALPRCGRTTRVADMPRVRAHA